VKGKYVSIQRRSQSPNSVTTCTPHAQEHTTRSDTRRVCGERKERCRGLDVETLGMLFRGDLPVPRVPP
jgi:hypothetical protein